MANQIPPAPVNAPVGSFYWLDWYEKVRNTLNSATSVLWSNIDFTGSNITDITNRSHNNLQTLQGGTAGEYYHLSLAQNTNVVSMVGGLYNGNSKASDPTTTDIPSGKFAVYKNTSTAAVKLWYNDSGTLKSVALV